jgi:hypothetical protein
MIQILAQSMLAAAAIIAVSALAFADDEDTVVKQRTYESQREAVEVPSVRERVVEERAVIDEPPAVERRTDTTITTGDNDNLDDDDDDD